MSRTTLLRGSETVAALLAMALAATPSTQRYIETKRVGTVEIFID